MKNNMITVGLDIGTTKVVVIVGEKHSDGTVHIIGLGQSPSTGVDKGAIQNITKTTDAIRAAVTMAEQSSGYKINQVTVGIAGQYIRSTRQTEYITRSDVNDVISQEDLDALSAKAASLPISENETILHILPQEYRIDSQGGILEPIGMAGRRLEATFHIVIGQIAPLQNIKRCVEGAGLKLAGVCLQPMASADAVLSADEKEAGVVMVDIGGGTTDLVIMRDFLVRHSSVLPMGGNIITEDIIAACSILKRNAELLKKEYGSTWPGENSDTDVVSIPVIQGYPSQEISLKDLSKVIYARMDEILDSINAEIATYRQIEPGRQLIGGIVLTGGGALLKHLQPFTHYKTGMNCRIGLPNVYVDGHEGFDIDSPTYSTCIGLLLSSPAGKYVEVPHAEEEEEKTSPATSINIPYYEEEEDNTIDEDEDQYIEPEEEENDTPSSPSATESSSIIKETTKPTSTRPSFIKTLKEKTGRKIEDVTTRTNKAILDFLQKLGD